MYPRGFKTWCENVAVSVRSDLQLNVRSPLDPRVLAGHLDVALNTPDDIPGIPEESRVVLREESADWSAVTVSNERGVIVVYNPDHSAGRNANDVMHELAHVMLKHDPSKIVFSEDTSLALRKFDRDQEDQATWLAGCLLLPRPALLWIVSRAFDDDRVCEEYRVSPELLDFRRNITGVNVQVRRSRASGGRR